MNKFNLDKRLDYISPVFWNFAIKNVDSNEQERKFWYSFFKYLSNNHIIWRGRNKIKLQFSVI